LAVHGLFNENKKTREVYIAEEFRNVKQGNVSVGDYLNRQKAAADALAKVGAPVSDSDLITNVIKGLDERFAPSSTLPLSSHRSPPSSTSATCCSCRR
jgi:hypothetical protein